MQRIKDLLKSVFALRASVICLAAVVLSSAVIALALNLTVYEVKIDDNGNTESYKVYSRTVKGALAEAGVCLKEGDVLSANPDDKVRKYPKIAIKRAKTVTVALNDKVQTVHTASDTVNDLISEMGIELGDKNLLLTDGNTPISENLKIEIIKKVYREVKETEAIHFTTENVKNNKVKKGIESVKTAGVNGEKVKTYKVLEHNGQVIEKTLVSEEVTKKPVSKVVEYGTMVVTTDRGANNNRNHNSGNTQGGKSFSYSRVLDMTAYAYTGGGRTASGTYVSVGQVAVDPNVIPLGSRLYIEAWDGKSWVYGYATATDTGGNIKGNKIDLYRNTNRECLNFGVKRAKVYVLN